MASIGARADAVLHRPLGIRGVFWFLLGIGVAMVPRGGRAELVPPEMLLWFFVVFRFGAIHDQAIGLGPLDRLS